MGVKVRPEGLQSMGCRSRARVSAGGSREGFEGVCVREKRFRGHTCGWRAPGTLEGARGRRPCERMIARGGTRRVCAEAPGAQCVCARVRGARAPQFSRTPRGGGGAGVRVTSPRAPVIIARCRSRARIRAEAAAAAGAGTVVPRPARRPGAGSLQR